MAGYPQTKKCCCGLKFAPCDPGFFECMRNRLAVLDIDVSGAAHPDTVLFFSAPCTDFGKMNGTYAADGPPWPGDCYTATGIYDGWAWGLWNNDAVGCGWRRSDTDCGDPVHNVGSLPGGMFLCFSCNELGGSQIGVNLWSVNPVTLIPFLMFEPQLYDWDDFVALFSEPVVTVHFPLIEATFGECNNPGGSGATLRLYGAPRCEECTTAGPLVELLVEPVADRGCTFNITGNATPRDGCALARAILYSDTYSEEIPIGELPFTIERRIGSGCGEHSGQLKLLVVDECGCTGEASDNYSCCNCDDGSAPCDGSTPALVYEKFGDTSIITDCPIEQEPPENWQPCVGQKPVWTCDVTLGFSWPKRHACGSFALVVDFTGDHEGDDTVRIVIGAGGPDPDTAYFEFTIPGVKFGFARHIWFKAYLVAVGTAEGEDPGDEPVGCQGPTVCWRYLNNPYYPGNSTWDGTDTCAYEYVDPCDPPELPPVE